MKLAPLASVLLALTAFAPQASAYYHCTADCDIQLPNGDHAANYISANGEQYSDVMTNIAAACNDTSPNCRNGAAVCMAEDLNCNQYPDTPPAPVHTYVYYTEDGFDYPGNDLTSYAASGISQCEVDCGKNNACLVASFVKIPGICYLKSRAENRRPNNNVVTAHTYEQKDSVDYWYNDIRGFQGTYWGDCVTACSQTDSCVGTVFAPDTNYCWLKSALSPGNFHAAGNRVTYIRK